MNSRERIIKALNHEEPDRVPFDLGSTVVTGISHITYCKLLPMLGLDPNREIVINDIAQQIAEPDEDFLQKMGVDVRGIWIDPPSEWQFDLQEDEYSTHFTDHWGITWSMPKKNGRYYDMVSKPPLPGDNPTDIDKYPWPEPNDPTRWQGFAKKAKAIHDAGEYATIMVAEGMTCGLLQQVQWLQGFVDSYTNLAGNRPFMHKLLDKLMELDLAFFDVFLPAVNPNLDIILYPDDFGGQNGLLISKDMFREYFKPRYKKIFALLKQKAPNAKIFLHTCGDSYEVIADFIEIGIDILNPVQYTTPGMDTKKLKKEFGKDVTFWGGGIETQHILPNGTVQQVKDEVKKQLDILAPGGGFVFATVHNILQDVPPENVMAMKEALDEYGLY